MPQNMLFANKRLISIFTMFFLAVVLLPAQAVHAEGGIAVSGSFARHNYKMVPGESIDTPHVNVVIFNNYNKDIDVKLTPRLPEGVHFHLKDDILHIPAHKNVNIPIGLTVGQLVVPGEYEIGLAADVLPDAVTGISIVGSAELRSRLTVFGEAGWVHIKTETVKGEHFPGTIQLSLKEEGQLFPAGYSKTGELDERVIPGNYIVQAFWEGAEVAMKEFSLAADEEKEITLVAQTVFIDGFFATSQYPGGSEKISSVRMTYTIKNVYRPLKDVRTTLCVYHRDRLLEKLEMFSLPVLELGSQGGRYTYIPPQGWQNGVYRFVVNLYAEGDVLYAQSREQEIEVRTGLLAFGWIAALILIAVLLVIFIILWKRRKCDKCKGEGVIDCSHCEGHGQIAEDSGRIKKCTYCNGTGKVECPKCGNKDKELSKKTN